MTSIDHARHGWTLLALKLPEIRPFRKSAGDIAEMCESYSLAVLYLEKLKAARCDQAQIDDYETLISGIEEEVVYFVKQFAAHNV